MEYSGEKDKREAEEEEEGSKVVVHGRLMSDCVEPRLLVSNTVSARNESFESRDIWNRDPPPTLPGGSIPDGPIEVEDADETDSGSAIELELKDLPIIFPRRLVLYPLKLISNSKPSYHPISLRREGPLSFYRIFL